MSIKRVRRVFHKSVRLVVETNQRAAPGSQPECAGGILMHYPDRIRDHGRILRNGPIVGKAICCRIEVREAPALAPPHTSVPVPIYLVSVVGDQAVGITSIVPVMLKSPGVFI